MRTLAEIQRQEGCNYCTAIDIQLAERKREIRSRKANGSLERIVSHNLSTIMCALDCAVWWEESLIVKNLENARLKKSSIATASKYRRLRNKLAEYQKPA